MSKVVAILMLYLCASTFQQSFDEARLNMRKAVATYRATCIEDTKADPAIIDHVITNLDFPDEPYVKCYFNCVMEKTNAINNRLELQRSFLRELLDKVPEATIDRVVEKCHGIEGDDKCQRSYEILRCGLIYLREIL
ncbi:general odorant-binding protein 56d-like [Photinus pyralis]|uniref:general odorant-binding protein 56d-like n=1 Tax=Photinus pyralis TaxID=7054 RepID=UPI0012675506|nr:general odorant-binding protein 56d-like [Photinus pyralis]